jgi:CheY-like chemotaxis protein
MRNVLFVDDEFVPDTNEELGSYMSLYAIALSEKKNPESRANEYKLSRASAVDEALLLAQDNKYDLIILDVMMPPGLALKDDNTMKGARSGVVLARKLHKLYPATPLFLLSNAAESLDLFADVVDDGTVARVMFKLEMTPNELVEQVGDFFEGDDNA